MASERGENSIVEAPEALGQSVASRLVRVLTERGQTVATAESVTGGRVASLITAVPGSSAAFLGGVLCYATQVKIDLLHVPTVVVAQHGVVSAACAEAMALGVRQLLGTTYAVATTGVAGPGRSEGQAPGTVWIGVAGPDGTWAEVWRIDGDRSLVLAQAARHAADALEREVMGLR